MRNKISKTKSKRNRRRKIKKKISRRKKIMKNKKRYKKSRGQYGGKGACPDDTAATAAAAAPDTQPCVNYIIMGHGAQIIKPGKYTHIKRIKIPSWVELIWYAPLGHSLIGGRDTAHGPGNALARQICKAGDSPAAYKEYVRFV